jgi:hypothetical protein
MKFLVIFLSVGAMLSCSSSRIIKSEIAEGLDWSAYKTFDFYKLEASGDTLSEKFGQGASLLKTTIANELLQKGYRQAPGSPDLLVNIGICVQEKTQTRETDFRTDAPRYFGQRRYSWKSKEVETGRYRMGTVDIHLVDAQKNTIVWQKVAEGVIPERDKKLDEKVKEGVKKIFSDFPAAVTQ